MKKSEILEIIKEEIEVVLTNDEAVEIFDLDLAALLENLSEITKLAESSGTQTTTTIKDPLGAQGTTSREIRARTQTAETYAMKERQALLNDLKEISADGVYSPEEKKRLAWTEHVETFVQELLSLPEVIEDNEFSSQFARVAETFRKQLYAIVRKVKARKDQKKTDDPNLPGAETQQFAKRLRPPHLRKSSATKKSRSTGRGPDQPPTRGSAPWRPTARLTEKKLTSKARKDLSSSSFIFSKERKFPIPDEAHGRNALSRANQYSSAPSWYDGSLSSLVQRVHNAVKKKFPGIETTEKSAKPGKG